MKQVTLWIFVGIVKLCSAVNETCILKSRTVGICKPIIKCDVILETLTSGDLSYLQSCQTKGEIGIYCCPLHLSKSGPKLSPLCQKSIQIKENLRINSTEISSNAELPFLVQILSSDKDFIGCGVLLSKKFVLTSAHAVYVRRTMPIVRFGKNRLDAEILNINVKQVIPHELYLPRETYFDVALLLLSQAVKFDDLTFPVCLHNSQIELGNVRKFIRSGWMENGLMKSEVQKMQRSKCDAIYDTKKYKIMLSDGISNSLFCGWSKEFSVNSDGPIHVLINNTFFIYGFTTAINTNYNSELPGLYTKMSDVANWIEDIIFSTDSP
ncbi:unnamed protein product [Chironomus riparius]|uniref:Peptidase S1 domain-containing protein n=1 Tax=Chironomus riparius TaxID=315576 RepID=A0A9N9WRE5_9DIPT|nr:unnamed protein product [Chironomus riparius]